MFGSMNPVIRDWRDQRVWIVGASSGIGAALSRELLSRGARVALSARRAAPLAEIAQGDHRDRAVVATMDVTDPASVRTAHRIVLERFGRVDLTIWVAGTYAPMRAAKFDLADAHRTVRTNVDGVFNGLSVLLPTLRGQRSGGIALVSSVAGYRGLPMSLVYGPTKAALINLAESLYLDMHPLGVGVWLVSPGFVRTPLTDLNDFNMPALISAETAARRIADGFAKGAFEIHFPRRFTWVMKALRLLPARLYFALVRRFTRSDPGALHEAGDTPR